MKTLIAGCGYTGNYIREHEQMAGNTVTATGRNPDSDRVKLDLDTGEGLDELADQYWDRCYYLLPPAAGKAHDIRLQRFLAAFPPGALKNVVYFSTTAVYGDVNGAWVTETSPAHPTSQRGHLRLDAEQQWQNHIIDGSTLCILRVAGIYGPDRWPLEKLRNGIHAVHPEQAPFSNRIHVSDLANIAFTAMQQNRGISVYNVADGHPDSSTEYLQRVARHFELPQPELIDIREAAKYFSPMALSFLADNKRVDNRKILAQLNIRLKYPDVGTALDEA